MQRQATPVVGWGPSGCTGGRIAAVRGAPAPRRATRSSTSTWLRSSRNTIACEAAPLGERGSASASSAGCLLAAAASPSGLPPPPSRFRRRSGLRAPAAASSPTISSTSAETSSSQSNIPADLLLGDVRVVLVQPKHEANIGAAARAAANFECVDLVIVAPRCAPGWREGEAGKVAVGGGSAIVLGRARVVASLEEALADTAGSIGFTRRAGAARLVHASIGHLAAEFPWTLSGAGGGEGPTGSGPAPVTALVFGREESGLTEAELRLCSHACAIPTGRLQPSMNLSHAVSVVLAELFSRRSGLLAVGPASAPPSSGSGLKQGADAASTAAADGAQPASADRSEPAAHLNTGSDAAGSAGGGTAELSEGGDSAAAGRLAPAGPGGGSAGADPGLQPASAREVELLLEKAAAVAAAVGISPDEGRGGGGNHGRRRLPIGHLRAVLSRARLTAAESSSLHGLASAVLQRLDPEHPLEARKAANKQRQEQRFKERQERRQLEEEQARATRQAGGQEAEAQARAQAQAAQEGCADQS
ncbi:hypothetical protein HYH03_003496 [Edaphochlamys debaryana]|uniref:tRNA/rRNA methyltransferase SpoU type domain-containing protein n=1 Tax=Edaphochlamys debaryana TaxID=47281 RepID=A0A835YC02_9CHLO|nr:hypothetical protein HYH03_003496 [Edaphochlamys debaryana]|eukprot:KAG2498757.1 hypothetical protein HYH03_003496 [Edaphochlamys debaryana]